MELIKCDQCGKTIENTRHYEKPGGWSSIYWTHKPGSKAAKEFSIHGADELTCSADICDTCTAKLMLPAIPAAVKGQLEYYKQLFAGRVPVGKV